MIKRILIAEGMKLKPAAYWLPLISSTLFIAFTALEWYLYFRQGPQGVYAALNVMYLFLSFTMLLNTAILASLLSGVEHDSQSWKQLAALPVSRPGIYWGKAIWILMLLVLTSVLIIVGMSVLWLCYTSAPLPFLFLAKQTLYCCLASVAVLAFQLWLSVHFPIQAIPLAIGFLGAVSSLFLARAGGSWWTQLVPWTYPSLSSPYIPNHLQWIGISLGLGAILLTAGSLYFRKKQFY